MKQEAEDEIRAARKTIKRAEKDLEDAEKRREKGIAGMAKAEAEFHRRFPGQIMDH